MSLTGSAALWDAAFDRELVTFDNDGRPEFSPVLSEAARTQLCWQDPIPLTDKHRERLALHWQRLIRDQGSNLNTFSELSGQHTFDRTAPPSVPNGED